MSRLLEGARAGDEVCLAAWIRRSQADVWRLCAHLVDAGAADDLTQETFVRAWRALPGFRGESSARTWLLSIAHRVCADALRARTRRRRMVDALASATTRTHGADHAAELSVRDLVTGLPADRRTAFVLTQVIGLSYAEAAQVCDCPVGTIRSRVARARADLLGIIADVDPVSHHAASTADTPGST